MQVIIAGGGPAGACAAEKLAVAGIRTIIFERDPDGDKTCAGGIPSALVRDFNIPDNILQAKCQKVRFFGPSGVRVEMEFPDSGCLATIRRREFDTFLRERAISRGAILEEKEVMSYEETQEGLKVHYKDAENRAYWAKADYLIGADGAVSRIARILHTSRLEYVATMQEYLRPSAEGMKHWNGAAELYYSSKISPDYYGWVFPHKDYISIGVGMSYDFAKDIRGHFEHLKKLNEKWLEGAEIIGTGSAPIPLNHYSEPARRRVFLVGDAAGYVLPGSGEGIYYAMKSGQCAAESIIESVMEYHSNPELIYNRRCDREFKRNFDYFRRIEKLAFKNDFNRELFVRYCREPHVADNFLNMFTNKKKTKRSGISKKIRRLMILNRIRGEITMEGLEFDS